MSLISWFKNLFSRAIAAFKAFIGAAFPTVTQIIIGQLKDIAINIVSELATGDLSDEAKRKEAFNRIKEYAKLQGIEARDSIINLIIELAVQALKNEQA